MSGDLRSDSEDVPVPCLSGQLRAIPGPKRGSDPQLGLPISVGAAGFRQTGRRQERAREDMLERIPEDMPGRMSEDIPETKDMSDRVPERMPEDIPETISENM